MSELIDKLYQQIIKFGMVIGAYEIDEVVKEAHNTISEMEEIIQNYQQAHEDDQVTIQTMDKMIVQLKSELSELKKGGDLVE